MNLFCPNCGKPAADDHRFCEKCGYNLDAVRNPYARPQCAPLAEPQYAPPAEPQYAPPAEQQYTQPAAGQFAPFATPSQKPPKKEKSKWLFLIPIAILLVLAVVIAAIATGTDGGTDAPDTKETESGKTAETGESKRTDSKTEEKKPSSGKVPTRTVMIYVVASDLESRYGAATLDLDEIVRSEANEEKVNVLIYTGGAKEWQNDMITEDKNYVLLLEDEDYTILDSHSSKNMAESDTLADFLSYCEEEYPAQAYDLILWNHGAGPLGGFGLDEQNRDVLSLQELSRALADSPFGKNQKLELLGFDACLMGSLETAWIFRDYAEYFVASQEIEPGYGWDYAFLGELDNCINGGDVGKVIIEYYFDFYEDLFKKRPREETEITLSCTDLSAIDEVESALEDLFESVSDELSASNIKNISRFRYKTKSFGKFASSTNYDLVDLQHLVSFLEDDYGKDAKALQNALDAYVVYEDSNVKNAGGVSLYHPYDAPENTNSAASLFSAIGFAPEYASYIKEFTKKMQGGSSGSYRDFADIPGKAVVSGEKSDLSLKLTAEQMETFSAAHYYVFKELPADTTFSGEVEYLHIFSGQDVTLSADGTLKATYQGKAVFGKDGKTGEYSSIPLSMYQIYDGSLEQKFYFPCMFWHFGENLEMDLIPVNWLMKLKDGKPTLLNCYDMLADENEEFPSKFLIDSEDYEIYTFSNNSYSIGNGDEGATLTFTGSSYGFEYTKENGFSLELRSIDYDDGYYAVFVIEDIYGNSYNSAAFRLGK